MNEPQTSAAATPKTDAATKCLDIGSTGVLDYVDPEVCAQLERTNAELLAALTTAAIRFELIASGCSVETASPIVGAKEARAAIERAAKGAA